MLNREIIFLIWNKIKESNKITIATHVDCDGDTIASAVALKELILCNLKNKEVKISGEPYPRYLNFLDGNDEVADGYFNDSLKIVVDTSTKYRIHDKRVVTEEAIKIDHHHKEGEWLLEIGGDHWPATGQVIYEMAEILDLEINQVVKDAVFVAIWTDTDKLTQRNISEKTIEVMDKCSQNKESLIEKMNLIPSEEEHISKLEKQLKKISKVTYLLTEDVIPNDYIRQATGHLSNLPNTDVYFSTCKKGENLYRGELRSKDGTDVSVFAKHFGGGGHKSSSGFLCKSLDEAKANLEWMVKQLER